MVVVTALGCGDAVETPFITRESKTTRVASSSKHSDNEVRSSTIRQSLAIYTEVGVQPDADADANTL